MTRSLKLACGCFLAWLIVGALPVATSAPDRAPSGKSGDDALPLIELDKVPNETGVAFGDWLIWSFLAGPAASGVENGGPSIILINQKTNLILYVPWTSNGWVNYRAPDGVWYVLFPTSGPDPQDRKDLKIERFVGKQPPARVANGNLVIKNWAITITDQTMQMSCENIASKITVQRMAPEFVHNNRTIDGVRKGVGRVDPPR